MTRLALIHPTGILANELRESLDRRRELWLEIALLSDNEEEIGHLTEARGTAAMVQPLVPDSLSEVDVVFFGGSIEATRPLLAMVPPSASAVILSPDANLDDGQPLVGGVNLTNTDPAHVLLSPHPGAIALAHLLHPLRDLALRRATATLLQPISVHGNAALDEVFNQTRAILAFAQNQPRDIFPTQMAFNVLPTQHSADAVVSHLHSVLGEELPVEVQVLQAGIFHSYGVSLTVEFETDPGQKAVEEALTGHPMIDRAPDPELLGPIDAAAREEVILGPVEADGRRAGVYRLWAVMDNLTCGGALNAIQILEAVGVPVTN